MARLIRLAGIEGAHRRRRGKPRRTAKSTATDLVQRQFTAITAPNRLWVADISYLRTWEGFLYLAASSTPTPGESSGGQWPIICVRS
ncbi:hypothetical protein [Micromonospora sp. SH-82]|uniref:hypothetical protein n=1 Tax=Micromonospora sp. SH-82 TaxID=3132938 RepID=UPI003EBD9495